MLCLECAENGHVIRAASRRSDTRGRPAVGHRHDQESLDLAAVPTKCPVTRDLARSVAKPRFRLRLSCAAAKDEPANGPIQGRLVTPIKPKQVLRRFVSLILLGLSAPLKAGEAPVAGGSPTGIPPPVACHSLSDSELVSCRQGQEIFGTHWVAAGTSPAGRRSGLGPLFNAASCDACHAGGSHGQGPTGDGVAPVALVIKLETPAGSSRAEPTGDPVYGRVLNTSAIAGAEVEGTVIVSYREITGNYYPGGGYWHIRDPQYRLAQLRYGPLAPTTVIQPRVAPALFGLGLIEAVPDAAIVGNAPDSRKDRNISGEPAVHSRQGVQLIGRFGWQGNLLSVRDQTARAFVLEMGLTTSDEPSDDCTPAQADCLRLPNGGSPEVAEESLEAVVAYVKSIAVPEPPTRPRTGDTGARIFRRLGCDVCHHPQVEVEIPEAGGTHSTRVIAPYTDLRLHDFGPRMADRDVSGKAVISKWRTAPLWGLGYRTVTQGHSNFLHDGRARTIEEAILWHLGEGATSLSGFKALLPGQRDALLEWLEGL